MAKMIWDWARKGWREAQNPWDAAKRARKLRPKGGRPRGGRKQFLLTRLKALPPHCTVNACANALRVDRRTVSRWIVQAPQIARTRCPGEPSPANWYEVDREALIGWLSGAGRVAPAESEY